MAVTDADSMKWIGHKRRSLAAFYRERGLVDVYVCEGDVHTYLILAERYDNPAASVTNNYGGYADQVCDWLALQRERVVFLELYRRPATPKPNAEPETITLDRYRAQIPHADRGTRWRPLDDALRVKILDSLTSQHELTFSYRPQKGSPR